MTQPYIFYLLITIFLELGVYFFLLKRPILYILFYAILINCVTHPLATIFYYQFDNLILVEFGVFIIEVFLIKSLFEVNYKKAIIISLIANIFTTIIGLIVFII